MKLEIEKGRQLSKYQEELKGITHAAFKDASTLLPIKGVSVFVSHNPSRAIPEYGVGGYASNGEEVYISVDARHPRFTTFVIPNVYRTLLHEFHHVARWRGPGYGETLLEALITEGLADHFELEITNNSPQPWDKALTVEEEKTLLKRAEKELNDKKYSHEDWFYGSKKRKIPRWTGYTLGFSIIREYLKKNPDKKPSGMYSRKAQDFHETC